MKQSILTFTLILLCISCSQQGSHNTKTDLTQYANPFIGTSYVGHTHPAAQMPFGMVQVGAGYGNRPMGALLRILCRRFIHHRFSHTHLSGTGCPDMGTSC